METWRRWTDGVGDWWFRAERVVGAVTAVLIGLVVAGLLVVPETWLDGVDAAGAPAVTPAAPAPHGPASAAAAVELPDTLVLQPGGPAPAPEVADVVAHSFRPVAVGATSTPLMLEMTNPLAYPVEVRAVATPGSPAFAIGDDTCSAVVLAPRVTCRIVVFFAPRTAGVARSSVDVTLRQVCTSPLSWPCDVATPQGRALPAGVLRTVLPSGQPAVDWTTALNDGWAPLRVEGTTTG